MLSRTAENLYWTARYIERADSIARLLEVAYRIHLIPNTSEGYLNEWESILSAAGIKESYLNNYKEISKNKIEYFLLFDPNNSSSVKACIESARNNLKMVRTAVTLEVWNTVNTWYHEIDKYDTEKYDTKNLPMTLDWIKKQVNLIKGTINNTQLINDGFDFIYLGIFYERADFTARIIDVKYYILLPSSSYVGTQVDNFQWSIMLRSVSAYRGFKWAYGNSQIDYTKIIDFLILSELCPRSIFYALDKIQHHLGRLTKFYKSDNKAHRNIKSIHKGLTNSSADEIIEFGLHEFLTKFIDDMSTTYSDLEEVYFLGIDK